MIMMQIDTCCIDQIISSSLRRYSSQSPFVSFELSCEYFLRLNIFYGIRIALLVEIEQFRCLQSATDASDLLLLE